MSGPENAGPADGPNISVRLIGPSDIFRLSESPRMLVPDPLYNPTNTSLETLKPAPAPSERNPPTSLIEPS